METENIKNDECVFVSQCKFEEVIEIKDSPSPTNLEDQHNAQFSQNFLLNYENDVNGEEVSCVSLIQEEPIDLTFVKSPLLENVAAKNFPGCPGNTQIIIQQQPPQSSSLPNQGFKRKSNFQHMSNKEVTVTTWSQCRDIHPPPQTYLLPRYYYDPGPYVYVSASRETPHPYGHLAARQQEVLKMAKSVFSKRTRTLYHWIYPGASKQQIKQVVSSTWDSMPMQEKNIYVAQVLAKFGYTNGNLMVNPQLGQIKDLPPTPGIQKFNSQATELQNAISSITGETESLQVDSDEFHPSKKPRYARRKNMQNLSNPPQEFEDDPELSKELAQFSIMFKEGM